MITSSHEPFKPTIIGADPSVSTLLSSRSGKSSLYSIITGRSGPTITAPTPLQTSATSSSNAPDVNISRLRRVVNKAKSMVNIKGLFSPSAAASPSNLSRSHPVAAFTPRRMDFWMRSKESDEMDISSSTALMGRVGQESRLRRANNQHLHQSQRDHTAPSSSPDLSDHVSTVPTEPLAVPEPTIVVGRGSLGSKPRIRLDSSPSSLASSSSHQRPANPSKSLTEGPSLSPQPIIRVTSLEGAGLRPRTQLSPSFSGSITNMCKLKLPNRKKSLPESITSPTLSILNPLNFTALRCRRANTLPSASLSNSVKPPPLPAIPAWPPASTSIQLTSGPDSMSTLSGQSDIRRPVPADPGTKLERTLGDTLPSNMLLSTSVNQNHAKKARRQSRDSTISSSSRASRGSYNITGSRRRASVTRSLSSIGSFIRLPKPAAEVYVYGDDEYGYGEEQVCWVDNEYDSHSREGASTPVSPITFSARPLSPVPPPTKPKLVIDLGTSTDPIDSVSPETDDSSVEGYEEEFDDDEALSDLLTSPNDSGVPDTPHSITSICDDASPVSSIIFSEHPVSILPPFAPSLDTETGEGDHDPLTDMDYTPRLKPKSVLSEPSIKPISPSASPSTLPIPLSRSSEPPHKRNSSSFSMITADLSDSPVRSALLLPPNSVARVLPRGWTGEWNRKDVREVIQSLRELK